jgi:protein SCO1/2
VTRLYRLLAAFAVVLTLAACSSAGKPRPSDLVGAPSSGPYQGVGMLPPQPRPSFMLTDTAGRAFSFGQATSGHPTLLFFGYTRCPDVCPTTMADIRIALTSLPLTEQQKVYVAFVSTDVQHDTAAVVRAWLGQFTGGVHATFVGLIGTQAQIDAAQTAAHITLATDGGQTHSARVLLYGADNYARVSFLQSSDEAQQMAHDVPLVS